MRTDSWQLTRRALAALVAAPAMLAAKPQAQEKVPADALVSAGRTRFRAAALALSSVKLARAVEPATRFEA